MTDNSNLIHFTYHNCDREVLQHAESSFQESDFVNELSKLFETKERIERVEIEVEFDPAHSTGKYTARLVVVSPDLENNSFTETAEEPASPVRKVIHAAIEAVHDSKEKADTEHHHPHQ